LVRSRWGGATSATGLRIASWRVRDAVGWGTTFDGALIEVAAPSPGQRHAYAHDAVKLRPPSSSTEFRNGPAFLTFDVPRLPGKRKAPTNFRGGVTGEVTERFGGSTNGVMQPRPGPHSRSASRDRIIERHWSRLPAYALLMGGLLAVSLGASGCFTPGAEGDSGSATGTDTEGETDGATEGAPVAGSESSGGADSETEGACVAGVWGASLWGDTCWQ
jgi:hypothetical protein